MTAEEAQAWLDKAPEEQGRFICTQIDGWVMKGTDIVYKNKRKTTPPDLTTEYGKYVKATGDTINLLEYETLAKGLLEHRQEGFTTNDVKISEYELTEYDKQILSPFRFAVDKNFRRILYVKIGKKSQTYKTVGAQGNQNSLGMEDALVGLGLYEQYRQLYIDTCDQLAKKGKLVKLIFGASIVENAEGGTQPAVLSFDEYLEKILQHFLRCEHFRITTPETISNNPQQAAFYHFDVTALQPGDWSEWSDWLTCMDDCYHDAFKAYIYSLYIKHSGRQALWLHGEGYNGKTVVIQVLTDHRQGVGVGSLSVGSTANQFGYAQMVGNNLMTFGDCKDPRLLSGTKIHSYLGGDVVPVEEKGQPVYFAKVQGKVIIASNVAPEINMSEENERTRIIYIPLHNPSKEVMQKFIKTDTNGELVTDCNGKYRYKSYDLHGKLLQQMPAFLYECQQAYSRCCDGGNIDLPDEAIQTMCELCGSREEMVNETYINEFISFDDSFACTPLLRLENHYMKLHKCNGWQYASFKRLLQNRGGKIKRVKNACGQRVNSWVGVTLLDKPRSGSYAGAIYTSDYDTGLFAEAEVV